MKRGRRLLCLALAVLMAMASTACGQSGLLMSDMEDVLSDVEDVLAGVKNILTSDDTIFGTAEPAPPTPGIDPPAENTVFVWAEDSEEAVSAFAAGIRAGTYEGMDGSVLTVEADGACVFETYIELVVDGKPLDEAVTLEGTVDEEGAFTFTKVTCHGLDLTALAGQSGYEGDDRWAASAAALYGK